jgi:hypothetical protein
MILIKYKAVDDPFPRQFGQDAPLLGEFLIGSDCFARCWQTGQSRRSQSEFAWRMTYTGGFARTGCISNL